MELNVLNPSSLKDKEVLLRVDYNVPLDKEGKVTDKTRILAHVPTLKALVDAGAKVTLASHLGRPKGKIVPEFSLRPVAPHVEEITGKKVFFCEDCIGEKVKESLQNRRREDLILLENLRYHKGEEANDATFAQALGQPFDFFVMDAFSASHRAHASTEGITHFLPSFAGFLLEKEVKSLGQVRDNPQKPFLLILGGAKVSDKIGVIENLLDKVQTILIGGGMAFTFFAAKGLEIGKSLCEEEKLSFVRDMVQKASEKQVEIVLPVDILGAPSLSAKESQVFQVDHIPPEMMGLDIGPRSAKLFREKITQASTVLWNGPMGVFENPLFAEGTKAVAMELKEVTAKGAITVVGGGDSASAINSLGLADSVTHVSTGGGASLEFFEGKSLPGIAPFVKSE